MQRLEPKMSGCTARTAVPRCCPTVCSDLRGTDIAARIDAVIAADVRAGAHRRCWPEHDVTRRRRDAAPPERRSRSSTDSPLDDALKERAPPDHGRAQHGCVRRPSSTTRSTGATGPSAFKGYPKAEAALRMQQLYYRSVMACTRSATRSACSHNFAGSLDRDNYHDAYFQIARDLPLPAYLDYDDPGQRRQRGRRGGRRRSAALRRGPARACAQERLARGAGNVMTASVMDYDGDLSGYSGHRPLRLAPR